MLTDILDENAPTPFNAAGTPMGSSLLHSLRMNIMTPDVAEISGLNARLAAMGELPVPTVESLTAERIREAAETQDGPALESWPGGDGPVPVRVVHQPGATAVLVNVHAGGWVRGNAGKTDTINSIIARRCGVTTCAPEYRLAPENPHPSALTDIISVISAVISGKVLDMSSPQIILLGSSAGAHLIALALIALRDQEPDLLDAIAGVALSYGGYDLGGTPSLRRSDERSLVIQPHVHEQFLAWAFPDKNVEERRDPTISPLYADLRSLPPALFTACLLDPVLDDSLFMASRWHSAGNSTELDLWQDCVHGFDARAPRSGRLYADRLAEWFASRLDPNRSKEGKAGSK